MPETVRRELAGIEQGCLRHPKYSTNSRGETTERIIDASPAIARPNAIRRADFNGDGQPDFLLDAGQIECAKDISSATSANLSVFVSALGGPFVHSMDAGATRYRIAPGRKASLVLTSEDADTEVTETIHMVDALNWSPSSISINDFRNWRPGRYPRELTELFAGWDRECSAHGQRFQEGDAIYGSPTEHSAVFSTIYGSDGSTQLNLDLNADGKRDYVVDTMQLSCPGFQLSRWGDLSDPNRAGHLITFVSRPDGTYNFEQVPGIVSFAGQDMTATLQIVGGRHVLCTPIRPLEDHVRYARIVYRGTTRQRVDLAAGLGCDGKTFGWQGE